MNKVFDYILDGVRALYPGEDRVPLSVPVFAGNEKKYLAECIDTTFVSSVGPFVDRFERDIAVYTGTKRAVVCVNGTSALHMALMLAGVERGDIVLTQALTFVATCNALSYIGADPVFIDIDEHTLSLSPKALRRWLEANAVMSNGECRERLSDRRIKAVVPMHTFGHPADLDGIIAVCEEWGLELVEDAAESIGSLYHGRHTGTFGKVGALSFNGNKTITTGGGGMLLFNDEEMAAHAKHLTTQAKVAHPWRFVHDEVGYNYRMPNINAALGCAQLEQIDGFIASKRATAAGYEELLRDVQGVRFVKEPEGTRSNYWLNAIVFDKPDDAEAFLEYSNNRGVMTRPAWELMCNLPMWSHCKNDGLEVTRRIASRLVNVPSSVRL